MKVTEYESFVFQDGSKQLSCELGMPSVGTLLGIVVM